MAVMQALGHSKKSDWLVAACYQAAVRATHLLGIYGRVSLTIYTGEFFNTGGRIYVEK